MLPPTVHWALSMSIHFLMIYPVRLMIYLTRLLKNNRNYKWFLKSLHNATSCDKSIGRGGQWTLLTCTDESVHLSLPPLQQVAPLARAQVQHIHFISVGLLLSYACQDVICNNQPSTVNSTTSAGSDTRSQILHDGWSHVFSK